MFYFAYGSNMNHEDMKIRCADSIYLGRGILKGYKFVYDGYSNSDENAVADIIKCENSVVYGGIFKITQKDLQMLDVYEGYPKFYKRIILPIENEDNKILLAHVYYRDGYRPGKPSIYYKRIILKGANDCNLPQKYIKKFLK